jgi:hypothetical protein
MAGGKRCKTTRQAGAVSWLDKPSVEIQVSWSDKLHTGCVDQASLLSRHTIKSVRQAPRAVILIRRAFCQNTSQLVTQAPRAVVMVTQAPRAVVMVTQAPRAVMMVRQAFCRDTPSGWSDKPHGRLC